MGVDDDIPVGRGQFENIIAIGKLVGERGTVHGWIYRTRGHLLVQRVVPALDRTRPADGPHTFSGVDVLHTAKVGLVVPCARSDYRYREPTPKRS